MMINGHPSPNPNLALLEILKHAINIENERKKNIEARAGFALAFLATTIVFILKEAHDAIKEDKKLLSKLVHDSFLSTPIIDFPALDYMMIIDILLCFGIIVLIFKSSQKMIDVFSAKGNYMSLAPDQIIDIALEDNDEALFSFDASGIYMEQLECNTKLTDIKSDLFEEGLLFLKYSISLICLRYLLKFLTVLFVLN